MLNPCFRPSSTLTEMFVTSVSEKPAAPERMAHAPGPPMWTTPSAGVRHWLTQVLPKAGFSSPITETVLPQTFTGMCTGT